MLSPDLGGGVFDFDLEAVVFNLPECAAGQRGGVGNVGEQSRQVAGRVEDGLPVVAFLGDGERVGHPSSPCSRQ